MLRQFGYTAALLMGGGTALDVAAQDSAQNERPRFEIVDTRDVQIAGVDEITIKVGGPASLKITEAKDRFDWINVDSTARRLSITAEDKSWFSGRDYAVVLTLPSLDSLQLSGAIDGTVTGIESDAFKLDLAGSVDVVVTGTCGTLSIDAAGSIDLDAKNLICADVSVDAAGSTDIFVHAANSLDVDAAGSNDVIYYGDPGTITSDVAGAGDVEAAKQKGR